MRSQWACACQPMFTMCRWREGDGRRTRVGQRRVESLHAPHDLVGNIHLPHLILTHPISTINYGQSLPLAQGIQFNI